VQYWPPWLRAGPKRRWRSDARIRALEEHATDADDRLRRLYKMVEDCIAELDDILKDQITALKAEPDTAEAALSRATGASRPPISIHPDKITAFGRGISPVDHPMGTGRLERSASTVGALHRLRR